MGSLLNPLNMTRTAVGIALGVVRLGASGTYRAASAIGGIATNALIAPRSSASPVATASATMLHPTAPSLEGDPLTEVHQRGSEPSHGYEEDTHLAGERPDLGIRPLRSVDGPLRDARHGKAFSPASDLSRNRQSDPEDRHVDAGATLVAESADLGAQSGAGAHVHIDEPWSRYTRMTAGEVNDRLVAESDAVVSLVLLFERSHRARKTVISAAERELERRGSP